MTESETKIAVRRRDGNRCVKCGLTDAGSQVLYGRSLDVHRTTPGSEYSVETGVCETLCIGCHSVEPRRFVRRTMNEFSKSIAANVRAARTAAGMTQADLAVACGIAVPHVSRLENGTHLPSVGTLKKVSDALQVPICSLLDALAKKDRKQRPKAAGEG